MAELFGWKLGFLAALLAGSSLFLLWGHPYGTIIEILEFLFVKF
jgi:hypothetical protein